MFKSIALVASTLVLSTSLQASVIYTYSGNTYNRTDVGTLYDTSMSVNAEFELFSALAPSLVDANVFVSNFNFTDGVKTVTNLTGTGVFNFSTDSFGNIIDWQVIAIGDWPTDTQTVGDERAHIFSAFNNFDLGSIDSCLAVTNDLCSTKTTVHRGVTDANSGSWSVSTVPIPAAVWLFGSGLLGLIGVARRKTLVTK